MAYTPELSQEHSNTLRRIAWALKKPMTKTMANIMDNLSKKLNRDKICSACQDRSWCSTCPFNHDRENTNEKTV